MKYSFAAALPASVGQVPAAAYGSRKVQVRMLIQLGNLPAAEQVRYLKSPD